MAIYGTTFSQKYCKELNLDWKKTYENILSAFNFKVIRLCAYWDLLESKPKNFNFQDLDYQINLAKKYNIKVVLALGRKVPRWPEFHEPGWALKKDYKFLEENLLNYLKIVVEKYKNQDIIHNWQIENEPLWDFGKKVFPLKQSTLKKEVNLIKNLDSRKIIITETAEHRSWRKVAQIADIVGINIYPIVYNNGKQITQKFSKAKYKIKSLFIKKPIIVTELQAEPWEKDHVCNLEKCDWKKSISIKKLKKNLHLAESLGVKEIWLWGAEWWIWLEKVQKNPEFVNFIRNYIT